MRMFHSALLSAFFFSFPVVAQQSAESGALFELRDSKSRFDFADFLLHDFTVATHDFLIPKSNQLFERARPVIAASHTQGVTHVSLSFDEDCLSALPDDPSVLNYGFTVSSKADVYVKEVNIIARGSARGKNSFVNVGVNLINKDPGALATRPFGSLSFVDTVQNEMNSQPIVLADIDDLDVAVRIVMNSESLEETAELCSVDLRLDTIVDVDRSPGDFDLDGYLTLLDLDFLGNEIRQPEYNARVDLNGNGESEIGDMFVWVRDLKRTWIGDANLDGEFNTTDLIQVFAAGKYEDEMVRNSGWTDGDWNADGEFESSDLVVAFSDGGYEKGLRPIVVDIPEPASAISSGSIVGLIGLLRNRRHRHRVSSVTYL